MLHIVIIFVDPYNVAVVVVVAAVGIITVLYIILCMYAGWY